MKHNDYKTLMQLALAGEIGGGDRVVLDRHIVECDECRSEYEELMKVMTLVDESYATHPTEQDLWQSRRWLRESLKLEPVPVATWERLRAANRDRRTHTRASGWLSWFTGVRVALSGAAAVAVGLLIGYLAFGGDGANVEPVAQPNGRSSIVRSPAPHDAPDHTLGPPTITNVRFVDIDPTMGEIELAYDYVRPARLRADVEDARMKRMLTYAMVNEKNPGVRLKAIKTIGAYRKDSADEDIKEALIDAAKTDPNDGVRKQALMALGALEFDENIKQTYLFVLANDSNAGMRVTAINMLADASMEGYRMGAEVMDALKSQMKNEDSDYIRARTGAFIQEVSDER